MSLVKLWRLLVFLFFLFSCEASKKEVGMVKLDPDKFVQPNCSNFAFEEYRILYYLDGDCGFCWANILSVEAFTGENDIECLFIAKTTELEMFNFNLEKANIASCVLVDKDLTFEKENSIFLINEIALIKGDGIIMIKDEISNLPQFQQEVLNFFNSKLNNQ